MQWLKTTRSPRALFVQQRQVGGLVEVLLALAAGCLQAASLAWPTALPQSFSTIGLAQGQPLWWGQMLAMSMVVHLLLVSDSPRCAAWLGWLFATAWLSCTFAWLFTSMHTYGGLPAVLAVLAVLLLGAVLSAYYAAASWCFGALAQVNHMIAAILFASLWTMAELARGLLLTGFGWGAVGYAHVNGPLVSVLPWLGLYGLCAMAALSSALLAAFLRANGSRQRLVAALALGGLTTLASLLPGFDGQSAGALRVTLLQGNIAQEEKFELGSGVQNSLRWYRQQLIASQTSLVITPETALPVLPNQLPDGYWDELTAQFTIGEQAALVGLPMGDFVEGYTNSVIGLQPGSVGTWRYDKHHLVPFGEFIPPLARWFTNLMHIPLGDFNRGGLPQPTFDWQGQRLAVSICYENLFGEEMAASFLDAGKAPTMLVNISNLGWFGERVAMDQHLQIARVRTLEFDRPFLLATNTGRTAVVDHWGRVTAELPNHVAQALTTEVQGRGGITPYAWWVSRWGQWPLALLSLLLVGVFWWRRGR
jgi:apolipoprotein N-acyltransferase